VYSKILVPLDGPTLSETILVAMSTHGKSGIGRWAIGSVTERVVRHSSDPVLVIRP
jgi:nucleotide-binding universal stress UspA family protein